MGGRSYESTHPLIQRYDDLARIEGPTAAERLVLFALLRFGDWTTGTDCYASVDRLRRWTGLTRRTVQRALRRLTCAHPIRAAGGSFEPCMRCPGGLDLLLEVNAPHGETVSYALVLGLGRQALLPELGAASYPRAIATVDKSREA